MSRLMGLVLRAASRLQKRRFDADTRRPREANQRLLRDILSRHRDTEFGRLHRFGALRTLEDFRRELPLATYEDFRPFMERIARGEQNVLTSDRVVSMGLTSGTTGAHKLIPQTDLSRRRSGLGTMLLTRDFLARAVPGVSLAGRGLLMMGAGLSKPTEGGLPTGPGSALAINALLRSRASRGLVSPPEVFFIGKQSDAQYVHLLFALAERSLESISTTFVSALLDLFHLIERQGPALMEDLARGTIRPEVEIAPEPRERILARLRPQPELAKALSRELEKGMEGIASRLWPNLKYLSGIAGGTFSLYTEKLRRYTGSLPLFSPIYASTEGMLGIGLKPDVFSYVLLPGSMFYEFIPAAEVDAPTPSVRLIDELKVGERYEVVITTRAGLYRYRMGDIIQVVDQYHRTPVVEVLYRRGGLLNVVGEKTSEHDAREALTQALAREGVGLVDFSTQVDLEATPQRYLFFAELDARAPALDPARVSAALDEALARINPFYETMRSPGKLGAVVFQRVRPGTFQALRELLIRRGASASQVKIPRVVQEGPLAELLREHRV